VSTIHCSTRSEQRRKLTDLQSKLLQRAPTAAPTRSALAIDIEFQNALGYTTLLHEIISQRTGAVHRTRHRDRQRFGWGRNRMGSRHSCRFSRWGTRWPSSWGSRRSCWGARWFERRYPCWAKCLGAIHNGYPRRVGWLGAIDNGKCHLIRSSYLPIHSGRDSMGTHFEFLTLIVRSSSTKGIRSNLLSAIRCGRIPSELDRSNGTARSDCHNRVVGRCTIEVNESGVHKCRHQFTRQGLDESQVHDSSLWCGSTHWSLGGRIGETKKALKKLNKASQGSTGRCRL
jgi:hypothetical protein